MTFVVDFCIAYVYNLGMNKIKRIIALLFGSVFLVAGVVGILVPLLPTTPFLLLSAALYARSSNRFYMWLLDNRWFGHYIKNYREGKGIPLKQKIVSISLLWLSIGYSVVFVIDLWWVRVILFSIAFGVSLHLIRIKTCHERNTSHPSVGNEKIISMKN